MPVISWCFFNVFLFISCGILEFVNISSKTWQLQRVHVSVLALVRLILKCSFLKLPDAPEIGCFMSIHVLELGIVR